MNFITIKNKTGIGRDTELITPGGESIPGVRLINIHPIKKDELIIATIEIYSKLDIKVKREEKE